MPLPSDAKVAAQAPDARPLRWGVIVGASLLAVIALVVGGVLGTWQWQRAHQQSRAVDPDPRAPIAAVMRPGEAGRGEGRLVEVEGQWADADVALVADKEIDSVPAVLLIIPLTVSADATGTGGEGTLGVMAGWLPADQVTETALEAALAAEASATRDEAADGGATIAGYVRAGEGLLGTPDEEPMAGAQWFGSISTASFAQLWDAPVYSYLVVADEPAPGWRALPAPAERASLDLRSLTYSLEWWVFGLFAAIVAARYIRDNAREPLTKEDS